MAGQNIARDVIADAVIGGSDFPKFNNANARIGVGDGATAHDPAQTDLQGTNKLRKGMEEGFPSRDANVLTFRAVFDESEANWDWNERALFNAASGGQMLNRIVSDLGSKTSAHTWVYTMTVTMGLA